MAEVAARTRALPLEFSGDLHHIGLDEFLLNCETWDRKQDGVVEMQIV